MYRCLNARHRRASVHHWVKIITLSHKKIALRRVLNAVVRQTRACPFPTGFSPSGDLSFRLIFAISVRRNGSLAVWPVPRLPGVGRSTDPSRDFQRCLIQTMPPDVTAHATCTPLRPSVDGVLETSAPGVSRPCTTGNTRAEDMGDRARKIPFDFVFSRVVGPRERAPSRDLKTH